MTVRYSTALRNAVASDMSYRRTMTGGTIDIYTGVQPATADAAATGTLLCIISAASGAVTGETLSSGTVTLTGGAAGSLDTLTVNSIDILGGAVSYITSLAATAVAIALKINNFNKKVDYIASANGAVVTITAMPGTGTMPNGFVVASTATTLTKIDANMAGGVAQVNGLTFDAAALNVLSKTSTQAWSGVNSATGTAGWFRFNAGVIDPDTLDTLFIHKRIDGAISTSGSDMNLTSTALVAAATTTLTTFQLTLPTL